MIRGWANYHRHITAKSTYSRVDAAIWRALWKWARKQHNNKSRHWIAEKYWHPGEGRGWIFAADTGERTENGKPIRVRLLRTDKTPIRRHVKIKSDANPFDPAWREYLERRVLLKRFGPDFVGGRSSAAHAQTHEPVVITGPAPAGF